MSSADVQLAPPSGALSRTGGGVSDKCGFGGKSLGWAWGMVENRRSERKKAFLKFLSFFSFLFCGWVRGGRGGDPAYAPRAFPARAAEEDEAGHSTGSEVRGGGGKRAPGAARGKPTS